MIQQQFITLMESSNFTAQQATKGDFVENILPVVLPGLLLPSLTGKWESHVGNGGSCSFTKASFPGIPPSAPSCCWKCCSGHLSEEKVLIWKSDYSVLVQFLPKRGQVPALLVSSNCIGDSSRDPGHDWDSHWVFLTRRRSALNSKRRTMHSWCLHNLPAGLFPWLLSGKNCGEQRQVSQKCQQWSIHG